jgi:hypothetical protein
MVIWLKSLTQKSVVNNLSRVSNPVDKSSQTKNRMPALIEEEEPLNDLSCADVGRHGSLMRSYANAKPAASAMVRLVQASTGGYRRCAVEIVHTECPPATLLTLHHLTASDVARFNRETTEADGAPVRYRSGSEGVDRGHSLQLHRLPGRSNLIDDPVRRAAEHGRMREPAPTSPASSVRLARSPGGDAD